MCVCANTLNSFKNPCAVPFFYLLFWAGWPGIWIMSTLCALISGTFFFGPLTPQHEDLWYLVYIVVAIIVINKWGPDNFLCFNHRGERKCGGGAAPMDVFKVSHLLQDSTNSNSRKFEIKKKKSPINFIDRLFISSSFVYVIQEIYEHNRPPQKKMKKINAHMRINETSSKTKGKWVVPGNM